MSQLKTLLLQSLLSVGAKAAAAGLDGDPKTHAKDALKSALVGLHNSPLEEAALDELVERTITPAQFGAHEARAEELATQIVKDIEELFTLAHTAE